MYELDSCSVAASYAAAAVSSWHCAAFTAECVPGHQAHLLQAVNIFLRSCQKVKMGPGIK